MTTDNVLNHHWSPTTDDPPRFWHNINDIPPNSRSGHLISWAMPDVAVITSDDPSADVQRIGIYGMPGSAYVTREQARELGAVLLAAAARAGGVFPGQELTADEVAEVSRLNQSDERQGQP